MGKSSQGAVGPRFGLAHASFVGSFFSFRFVRGSFVLASTDALPVCSLCCRGTLYLPAFHRRI